MQYTQESPVQQPEIIPTKHALKSGAYVITGKIVTIIASFAAVTVLANTIPKEIAGMYNYVMAAFTIISITTLPGMNNALARAVAKGHDGNVNRTLEKRFLFGTIGIVISIIIGIVELYLGHTELGIAFLIVAPFVSLTDTMSNFTTSFWQGKKDFKKSALYNALYYTGFGILNIIVFLITKNIYLILLGVLTGQTIVGYLVFQSIKRENNSYDPESAKLGYHLTIMQGFRTFASNIDRVIVWYLAGPAMVASYTFAATPVFKAYQLLPVGIVTLPHLSNHTFTSHTKKMVIKKSLSLFLISIPLVGIIVLIAPWIYKILFPLYPESVKYFQVLVAGLVFLPSALIDAALTAFHKTERLYITEIGIPLVKIALMIIGGYYFGIMGIVWGIFASACIDFIVTFTLFGTLATEKTASQ